MCFGSVMEQSTTLWAPYGIPEGALDVWDCPETHFKALLIKDKFVIFVTNS